MVCGRDGTCAATAFGPGSRPPTSRRTRPHVIGEMARGGAGSARRLSRVRAQHTGRDQREQHHAQDHAVDDERHEALGRDELHEPEGQSPSPTTASLPAAPPAPVRAWLSRTSSSARCSTPRIRVRLFDGKGTGEYVGIAESLDTFVRRNPERLLQFLKALAIELERRTEVLVDLGVSKATEELLEQLGGIELVIVDELATYTVKGGLNGQHAEEIVELLAQIASVGCSGRHCAGAGHPVPEGRRRTLPAARQLRCQVGDACGFHDCVRSRPRRCRTRLGNRAGLRGHRHHGRRCRCRRHRPVAPRHEGPCVREAHIHNETHNHNRSFGRSTTTLRRDPPGPGRMT
ncbi:hypothetical protein QFZ58_006150 [Streptomyces sp. B1I3]|nr:hypothetical protein [Streptomyces sp. B1I3]